MMRVLHRKVFLEERDARVTSLSFFYCGNPAVLPLAQPPLMVAKSTAFLLILKYQSDQLNLKM
jgi:hypothetical protein